MAIKIFAKYFFNEMTPLIRLAKRKPLDERDLPPLPEFLNPRSLPIDEQSIRWDSAYRLVLSLLGAGRRFFVPAACYLLLSTLGFLAGPILVHQILTLLSKGPAGSGAFVEVVLLAFALGMSGLTAGIFRQYFFYKTLLHYQLATSLLNKRLYWHSLHLSPQDRMKTPVGDIVNHMSTDTEVIANSPMIIGELINNAILIIGVVVLLFYYFGWAALGALLLFGALYPISKRIASQFSQIEEQLMAFRDQRVTLMAQILNAISLVKYYVLERAVHQEVEEIRDKELAGRWRLAKMELYSSFVYTAASTLTLFGSLLLFNFLGGKISAALIFSGIALFSLLEEPLGTFPKLLSEISFSIVAGNRFLKFFSQKPLLDLNGSNISTAPPTVQIKNLCFSYDFDPRLVLNNLSLEVPAGAAIAIVGPVAAGKSTLLHCLLGELVPGQGSIKFLKPNGEEIQPRIAYVSQQPYILSGTIRENILFGAKEISDDEIQRAVSLSALTHDLMVLPGGLDAEIGERGVNLSGGQRQRISLARAIIHKPTLVVMDDPLSAIDQRTERLLIENLILGEWKNITRIVVTHRLEFVHLFDSIAFVEQGFVREFGPFSKLMIEAPIFSREVAGDHGAACQSASEPESSYFRFWEFYSHHKMGDPLNLSCHEGNVGTQEAKRDFIEAEERAQGQVKRSVYWDYLNALGGANVRSRLWGWALLFGGSLAGVLAPLIQSGWLAYSSNQQGPLSNTSGYSEPFNTLLVYGVLGILVLAIFLINHLFWLRQEVSAGKRLHEGLFQSVIRAPMRFFSTNPVGRIVQRFSKDLGDVETHLQWSFESTVRCLIHVLVTIGLIISVLPMMGVLLMPVFMAYYLLQRDYRSPAREAKRLDSISRSPRFSHFKESLQGLSTIRAYRKSSWFMEEFYKKLQHNHHMFYIHYMVNRWFSSRIPVLGAGVASLTTITLSYGVLQGKLGTGTAGLVITYTLSLWSFLNFLIRSFAEVEARMTSMERVFRYSKLAPEPETLPPGDGLAVDPEWPKQGAIRFEKVWVKYDSDLPFILKGVDFSIRPQARVGIVGKTGAGKSTIFQTLFRMIELQAGTIMIDGINIARVPLGRLRKAIAIIPQDPVLLLGTLRSNLDRYGEFSDEAIYEVLEKVRLQSWVRSLPSGIQTELVENGANLSLGQRQLLCLARALLLKVRILILDEATASVDVQTDSLVQNLLRTTCREMTVLIIAHRLSTLADCDQIIELAQGQVIREVSEKPLNIENEISVAPPLNDDSRARIDYNVHYLSP